MLNLKRGNNRAQAATELAILGSLILVAFAYLISYSEQLNREQSHLMQTFRQSLAKTAELNPENNKPNNYAQVTNLAYRRSANVSSPYNLGGLSSYSSSAMVQWNSTPDATNRGVLVRRVNDFEEQKAVPKDQKDEEREIIDSTYESASESSATATFDKGLVPGGPMVTRRTLTAGDKLNIKMSNKDPNDVLGPFDEDFYLGPGGKYYSSSQQLEREREWSTPE